MSESYAVSEKRELLLDKVKKFILDNGGIVKKSQLAGLGIDYRRILDFVEKGDILRVKSGYYAVHLSDFTEEELVAKLFPDCVLNLENALYAYGYIKKKPYGWRLTVDKNTSKSRFKMDYPKIIPMHLPAGMYHVWLPSKSPADLLRQNYRETPVSLYTLPPDNHRLSSPPQSFCTGSLSPSAY